MPIDRWHIFIFILFLFSPSCGESVQILADSREIHPCRIQMVDRFNEIDATLQALKTHPDRYIVTDQVNTEDEWSVNVELLENGEINFGVSVRDVTFQMILDEYPLRDDRQLTFLEVNGYPCTDFEESLIYFLVMEWFYFG